MSATPFQEPSGPAAGAAADFDQTFATGPRCRLELSNVRGRISVIGWDRPEVHVRAVKRRAGVSDVVYEATRIEAWHEDDRVVVRTVAEGLPGFGEWEHLWRDLGTAVRALEGLVRGRKPAEVEYDVRIPRPAEVTLNGVSSSITVEDIEGPVKIRTVKGDCAVTRVQGDLDLHAVNGRLTGQELAGSVQAHTVSGDMELAGRLAGLRVNTVSGSVEVAGPLAATGRYDITTVSGSLRVRLPPDTGASISARGVSVDVGGDLPVTATSDRRQPGNRQWQGAVNGGGAPIHFQTVSGHLRLLRLTGAATPTGPAAGEGAAGSAHEPAAYAAATTASATATPTATAASSVSPPPPPAAPPPPSPDADIQHADGGAAQLAILRGVEAGELTVEEALQQLEAMHADQGLGAGGSGLRIRDQGSGVGE